jgi:hypothetical protein
MGWAKDRRNSGIDQTWRKSALETALLCADGSLILAEVQNLWMHLSRAMFHTFDLISSLCAIYQLATSEHASPLNN